MTDQTQGTPDTSNAATTQAPMTASPGTPSAPIQVAAPMNAPTPLEFIPEQYRNEPWATKYKSPDDFFKGFDNLTKLAGQKQVVQGLTVPGENATPEEIAKFYQTIGRPEAADKYAFPEDLKGYEGLNLDEEKQGFAQVAFDLGLTQKQADALFKTYVEKSNAQFGMKQEQTKLGFDKAVTEAFGEDYKANLDLAKKAAKTLGVADKLDSEGLSANPLVLKLCAELGKHVGEDSFLDVRDAQSGTSLKEEALKLQKSELYQKGDAATLRRVEEIYNILYPDK